MIAQQREREHICYPVHLLTMLQNEYALAQYGSNPMKIELLRIE